MRARGFHVGAVALCIGAVALAPQAAWAHCVVDLDKCVLVDDEGDGFADETCVDPATAPAGAMVQWQYTVSNLTDWHWDLEDCRIEDPDVGFFYDLPATIEYFDDPVMVTTPAAACVDLVNTATVTCYCQDHDLPDDGIPNLPVTDTDTASLTCLPPDVPDFTVDKTCESQVIENQVGVNYFDVYVENTGDLPLTGCAITGENLGAGDLPVCAEGSGVPCYTCAGAASVDLAVGASHTFECALQGLSAPATDYVEVTCWSGETPLVRTDDALCPVPPPDTPDFTIEKTCESQVLEDQMRVNYFDVFVDNTGSLPLTGCSITGESLGAGDLPVCAEGSGVPCYTCAPPASADLAVGADHTFECGIRGLSEDATDYVEVTCYAGETPVVRTDSALCNVPEPDVEVTKVCDSQVEDTNTVNLIIDNTGENDLYGCTVTDYLLLGGPPTEVPPCNLDSPDVCFYCDAWDGNLAYDTTHELTCHLVGLEASTTDRARVTCASDSGMTTDYDDDLCEVPPPPPELTLDKLCEPGEEAHEVGLTVYSPDIDPALCTLSEEVDGQLVPVCDESGASPCWTCASWVPDGEAADVYHMSCMLYGLSESADDTVTLTCPWGEGTVQRSDSDRCEVPQVTVDKTCEPYENDVVVFVNGVPSHAVEIVVANPSDVPLTNCVVQDELDVTCVNGECPWVDCGMLAPFDLAAGAVETLQCLVYGVTEPVTNLVEVTCEYDGLTVYDEDSDLCEYEEMEGPCVHRTPGYWKNHADVAQVFIDAEGPLYSCGSSSFLGDLCDTGGLRTQLHYHCAAAVLNLAGSDWFDASCSMEQTGLDFDIRTRVAQCCGTSMVDAGVCGDAAATNPMLEACKDDLDEFNNLGDFPSLCPGVLPGIDQPCDGVPVECAAAGGGPSIRVLETQLSDWWDSQVSKKRKVAPSTLQPAFRTPTRK